MEVIYVPAKNILTEQFPIKDTTKLDFYHQKIILNKPIPPVTLIDINLYSIEEFENRLKKNELGLSQKNLERELTNSEDLKENLKYWKKKKEIYILSDGNHRSGAYFFNNLLIPSREIKTFEDLKEINREFELKREKPPLMMAENNSLEDYLFRRYRSLSSSISIKTIPEKIQPLINSGELIVKEGKLIYEPDLPF